MLDANNYVYAFNKSRLDTGWKASIQKYEAYLLRNIYQTIESVKPASSMELANPHRYRVRTLPAAGALLREEDLAEQLQLSF